MTGGTGGGRGKPGRGLAFSKLNANTLRVTYDDGSAPTDFNVAGLNPRGAWAAATVYAVSDTFTQGGSTYRVTVTHTSPAVFAFDSSKMEVLAASGALGKPGNYVSANPAVTGPVLIVQGGAYVTANPNMLASLTSQLYVKGSDGLYVEGPVPLPWPAGLTPATASNYKLVLQALASGTNLLWLKNGDPVPAALGTTDAAYVELGTPGAVQDTVVYRKGLVYYDNTVVKTSDGFTAANYPNITALETVYTKLGTFTPFLGDDAGSPSGRTLEINGGGSYGKYGYLRTSYPTGSATFSKGSVAVVGKKGGGNSLLVAIMLASGSGATYTAVEARLNTATGTLALYTVVNGTEAQVGTNVSKGTVGSDIEWWIRLAVDPSTSAVQARAWIASGAEPSTWDLDTTQTAVNAAGLAGFRTDITYGRFGFFGVSRGDANAPTS